MNAGEELASTASAAKCVENCLAQSQAATAGRIAIGTGDAFPRSPLSMVRARVSYFESPQWSAGRRVAAGAAAAAVADVVF